MDRANRSMKQLNLTELSSKLNISELVSRIHLNSPKNQLLQIEFYLVITCFLFLVLSPARFFRSRYDHWLPKGISLVASSIILLLIPFVFGLMLNLDFKHELVPLWACLFLVILVHVPDPPEFIKGLAFLVGFVKSCLYVIYTVLLVSGFNQNYVFRSPVGLLYVGAYINIFESYLVHAIQFFMLRPISGMRSMLRSISKYLLDDQYSNNDDHVDRCSNTSASFDNPLQRCKYVVDPWGIKNVDGKIVDLGVTIEDIWRCEDGSVILSSDQTNELKNTCLSLSLVWKLLHRFLGVPSNEISQQEEAWKLVQLGLLTLPSPLKIIEVELAFLGEFFFSTYYHLFIPVVGWIHLVKYLVLFGGYIWASVTLFVSYHPGEQPIRIEFHGHDMDVILTAIVTISLFLLQLAQIILLYNSGWAKVKLICLYVRRKSWEKKNILDQCICTAAQILCPVRFQLFKPWQRKLGQFSFLDRCVYYVEHFKSMNVKRTVPWIIGVLRNTLMIDSRFSSILEAGECKTLSNEIEKIVIQSLQDRGPQLTNGIGSLEATDLPQETKRKLTFACNHSPKVDTDARLVLLWHIATSVCAINPQLPDTWKNHSSCSSECSDFHVATTLSNYCAYLIAFAPKLLPGHAATTAFTCTDAFEDGLNHLQSSDSLNYAKIMEIAKGNSDELEDAQRLTGTILQQGAALGKVLDEDIIDAHKRWKVLADFWAEMILYLAPNANNEQAHAERLVDGGEFITHLWALLFHAGIVDREC